MINQWVRQELEKTQLGNARRTNRFMKIVSNLSDKSTSSVPQPSGTWAETKATYDFWNSPYIKPAQLRRGQVDATLSRIKNHQIILAIQDTTELNYTTHKAVNRLTCLPVRTVSQQIFRCELLKTDV